MMTSNLADGSEKPVNYLLKHLIVSLDKDLTHGLSNDTMVWQYIVKKRGTTHGRVGAN